MNIMYCLIEQLLQITKSQQSLSKKIVFVSLPSKHKWVTDTETDKIIKGRLHQRYLNLQLVNLRLTLSGDEIVTYLTFIAPTQIN